MQAKPKGRFEAAGPSTDGASSSAATDQLSGVEDKRPMRALGLSGGEDRSVRRQDFSAAVGDTAPSKRQDINRSS